MKISIPKLKAILLYFCNNTDVKFLGKVKLMKLFYFLDFMHTKVYGTPVTYDKYIHLEHGPIPSAIKNLVDTAADDPDNSILSDTISFERPIGTDMTRFLPTRKFDKRDEQYFSKTELDILNRVCLIYGDKNTKYIEDASHNESPWKKTDFLEEISYELASDDTDCIVSKEDINFLQKISQ